MKYKYNKDFFKIWSDEMAYVLGFWFADGHITKNNKTNSSKTFGITQSTKDKYILESIKKAIDFNGPVKEEKKSKYPKSYLRIYSQEIYHDIINLGGMERKSSIVNFPDIPEKYIRKFILGFFDGDGSVVISNKNIIKIIFTGGEKFLEAIKQVFVKFNIVDLQKSAGTFYKIKSKNNMTYHLDYSGFNAIKILEWIYKDVEKTELYLKRKYSKFKSFNYNKNSKYNLKYKAIDEDGKEYQIYNLKQFLKDNKIHPSTFRKCFNEKRKCKNFTFYKI